MWFGCEYLSKNVVEVLERKMPLSEDATGRVLYSYGSCDAFDILLPVYSRVAVICPQKA